MTLYRHFASKDLLVAECLRQFARQADAEWDRLAATHAGNPRAELTAWLAAMTDHIVSAGGRGCALANAAVELADKDHPARKVIEEVKRGQRDRLVRLCRSAALDEPEFLSAPGPVPAAGKECQTRSPTPFATCCCRLLARLGTARRSARTVREGCWGISR